MRKDRQEKLHRLFMDHETGTIILDPWDPEDTPRWVPETVPYDPLGKKVLDVATLHAAVIPEMLSTAIWIYIGANQFNPAFCEAPDFPSLAEEITAFFRYLPREPFLPDPDPINTELEQIKARIIGAYNTLVSGACPQDLAKARQYIAVIDTHARAIGVILSPTSISTTTIPPQRSPQ